MAILAVLPMLLSAANPAATAAVSETKAAVLDHAVTRGDLLVPADFTIAQMPVAEVRGALSGNDVVGMEARRNLAAGSVVRLSDVMPRQLVRRGEPVAIRVVSGALTISAAGRALGSGAKGDMVRVVTATTSRTLDGFVDGAGSVLIVAP